MGFFLWVVGIVSGRMEMFLFVWVCVGEMFFLIGWNMLVGVSNSIGFRSYGGRYNLFMELCGLFDERCCKVLVCMYGVIGVGVRGWGRWDIVSWS